MDAQPFHFVNGNSPLSVSPDHILPQDKRPKFNRTPLLSSVPVIDLMEEPCALVADKISKACEEYGFVQIINHGVPRELPTECWLFSPVSLNSHLKKRLLSMWSECFARPWHPLDDILHLLPQNPTQYSEVMAEYGEEIYVLMKRLLSLISLETKIGVKQAFRAQGNYYPPCPDPELTLGLNVHTDVSALTIVRQSEGVTGLQVSKMEFGFKSNQSPMHLSSTSAIKFRVVTNKSRKQVSMATFYTPGKDTRLSVRFGI
ncbi:Detected protein of unknown function [Hibiscus syriacus]|uniref:Fe2OG dioxygenase domain-containing protein n=1 Tax=Hibiscus syriacus TaxID=106335 RepID=A0A6A2Z7K6_HIBSY|nr:Detected protein of unknown function [Hibiscus syriacus]